MLRPGWPIAGKRARRDVSLPARVPPAPTGATHGSRHPPPVAWRHPSPQRRACAAQARGPVRQRALDVRRARRQMQPTGGRPRPPRRRQGHARGGAGAQLARLRRRALRAGAPGCRARSDQLHAQARRGGLHPAPCGRRAAGHRQRPCCSGSCSGGARHVGGRVRLAALRRPERVRAGHDDLRRSGLDRQRAVAAARARARRPRADRLHERHRVEPQGRDAHARCGAVAIRELRDRREHRGQRPAAARAAALPLRAARRLPRPFDLRRLHQRRHRQSRCPRTSCR